MSDFEKVEMEIKNLLFCEFSDRYDIQKIYFFIRSNNVYEIFFFLKTEEEKNNFINEKQGELIHRIVKGYISDTLDLDKKNIEIYIQIDSDEAVQKKFAGNYFYRLR